MVFLEITAFLEIMMFNIEIYVSSFNTIVLMHIFC